MIRCTFVKDKVLQIYKMLPEIVFPLDLKAVIDCIPNCRYMSYQEFAKVVHCSIDEVIQICESKSGCTHYDIKNNRYLILCNRNNSDNTPGRQRWTCGHEIGHIVCDHHTLTASNKLSENRLITNNKNDFEREADYFSAILLAPFPLFKLLSINSPADIKNTFGLSNEASENRYKSYIAWKKSRKKTAWENDLINTYKINRYIKFCQKDLYDQLAEFPDCLIL